MIVKVWIEVSVYGVWMYQTRPIYLPPKGVKRYRIEIEVPEPEPETAGEPIQPKLIEEENT